MRTAQFLTGTIPGQLLGSHCLEYQQIMTNIVQTGETTLMQLLRQQCCDRVILGNLKRQIKNRILHTSELHYPYEKRCWN